MFKLFKDKITKLIEKRDALTIQRQRVQDHKNIANSKIGIQLDNLQKKSWRNQILATTKIEDINRQLEKIERDIISEKQYLNSIPTYKPEDIEEGVRSSFEMTLPAEVVTGRANLENNRKKKSLHDLIQEKDSTKGGK